MVKIKLNLNVNNVIDQHIQNIIIARNTLKTEIVRIETHKDQLKLQASKTISEIGVKQNNANLQINVLKKDSVYFNKIEEQFSKIKQSNIEKIVNNKNTGSGENLIDTLVEETNILKNINKKDKRYLRNKLIF